MGFNLRSQDPTEFLWVGGDEPPHGPHRACAEDSDQCLNEAWKASFGSWTCSGATRFCSSWDKDMHRCCPQACNVDLICAEAACLALSGKGECTFPNPALTAVEE